MPDAKEFKSGMARYWLLAFIKKQLMISSFILAVLGAAFSFQPFIRR